MRVAVLVVLLALGLGATAGAPSGATAPAVEEPVAAPAAITAADVLPVTVRKLSRRGRLLVTNPNGHWVRFLWGTFRQAQPDGRKRIAAYRETVVRVHRHRVDWIALLDGQVAGQGQVRGIRL